MWMEIIEAIVDVVTGFGSNDRDQSERRERRHSVLQWFAFAALVVLLFIAVFLLVFNM